MAYEPFGNLKSQLNPGGQFQNPPTFQPQQENPFASATSFDKYASPDYAAKFNQFTGGKYPEPAESTGSKVAGALGQAATGGLSGAAAGSIFGPIGTAIGGAIGAFTPAAVEAAKWYFGKQHEGTPEEQMQRTKDFVAFLKSQQEPQNYKVAQVPTTNNMQQGLQGLVGLRSLYDLFKGGQSFDPIEQQARRQFNEEYLPTLRAQGAGEGLSSHLIKGQRNEQRKFETDILAQKAKFLQEQNLARERNLPALTAIGQQSNFENQILPQESQLQSPQTLENTIMQGLQGLGGTQQPPAAQAQPAAPEITPEANKKYEHGLTKYKLGKTAASLPQEAQNQLRDIITRPEGVRQAHTPHGNPALIKKLNTPEKIAGMHKMFFSKNPIIARLASKISSERDFLALQAAERTQNAKELMRLTKKYL